MIVLTLVFFSAIFLGTVSNYEDKVLIVTQEGNHTLEKLLCEEERRKDITDNTEIRLDSFVNYNLSMSKEKFCIIENVQNLTLSGGSNESMFSNITCNLGGHPKKHTAGFGFVNVHNLTIKNLRIKNCASNPLVNNPKLEFGNQVSLANNETTLLLSHCSNVTIQHTQISTHSSGFLVIEEVLGELLIENLTAKWLCKRDSCPQSGDHPANELPGATDILPTKLQYPHRFKLPASAVIVVIMNNTSAGSNVTFQNCTLSLHHCSCLMPKLGFLYLNVSTSSNNTSISLSAFNFSDAIIFANLYFKPTLINKPVINPFQLQDCNFRTMHKVNPFKPQWNMIVLYSETQAIQIKMDRMKLKNSPMLVYSKSRNSNISVIITDIATNTSFPNAYSTLYLIYLCSIILAGTTNHCILQKNSWSAIVLVESELHLKGKVTFIYDIYSENSLLFFDQGANVQFIGNKADLIGGAICHEQPVTPQSNGRGSLHLVICNEL